MTKQIAQTLPLLLILPTLLLLLIVGNRLVKVVVPVTSKRHIRVELLSVVVLRPAVVISVTSSKRNVRRGNRLTTIFRRRPIHHRIPTPRPVSQIRLGRLHRLWRIIVLMIVASVRNEIAFLILHKSRSLHHSPCRGLGGSWGPGSILLRILDILLARFRLVCPVQLDCHRDLLPTIFHLPYSPVRWQRR